MRLRMLLFLALFQLPIAVHATPTAPSPLVASMDQYFNNPRSPGTFRALSGAGDPFFGSYPLPDEGFGWDDPFLTALGFKGQYLADCRLDYAPKTYDRRVRQLGAGSPYVRQWLTAQAAVFANCKNWEKTPFVDLPPPLDIMDPDLRRLQADDRAYQHASALFYGGKLSQARAEFAAIAPRSPHYAAAQFMVVDIDAGSGREGYPAPIKIAQLSKAKALLNDPKRKDVKAYAQEMIGWMGATADTPATRQAQVDVTIDALELPIAELKNDPIALARYRRAADDIGPLHGDFEDADWWLRAGPPAGFYASAAMMRAAPQHRVAAWALIPVASPAPDYNFGPQTPKPVLTSPEGSTFITKVAQSGVDGLAWKTLRQELNPNYNPEIWQEIHSALARLKNQPNDQDAALVPRLLKHQVATGLGLWTGNPDSISTVIAELHAYPYADSDHFGIITNDAIRDLIVRGDVASAREVRDQVVSRIHDSSRVSGTLILLLAEDDDHIASAVDRYHLEGSALLNLLPSGELAKLASNPLLAMTERARLSRAAWTRLYATKKPIPKALDATMRSLNPKVTAGWASPVGAQRGNRALLVDVLRSPAMNILATSRTGGGWGDGDTPETAIDVYLHSTNNWWCALDPTHAASAADAEIEANFTSDTPRSRLEPLLQSSALWLSHDAAEAAVLARIDSAPKQLSEAAIDWASRDGLFERHRDKDEALALAVRSTRYGCQMQGGHGVYSKKAFELLHSKFPDSDAAKRTKYWFDCSHFTYGCNRHDGITTTTTQSSTATHDSTQDAEPAT